MPQYDPWKNKRFGFPRKDAPAFQREWKTLNGSGVLISSSESGPVDIVKAASSVGGSGTLYLWGICLAAATGDPQALDIKVDNAGDTIITLVATQNGPFFLSLATPIEIPVNSKLTATRVAGTTDRNCYVTALTTATREVYE